eukprot:1156978-Pelagomonas_calceolata.AAC.2
MGNGRRAPRFRVAQRRTLDARQIGRTARLEPAGTRAHILGSKKCKQCSFQSDLTEGRSASTSNGAELRAAVYASHDTSSERMCMI